MKVGDTVELFILDRKPAGVGIVYLTNIGAGFTDFMIQENHSYLNQNKPFFVKRECSNLLISARTTRMVLTEKNRFK